jgi:methionyl-tRNA formyltransferase
MTETSAADSLRIVFAGTPEFSALHLKAIIESKHQLIGVYTQPDRPAGRGKKIQSSPVKLLAQAHGIPLFQPPTLKAEPEQETLAQLQADVLIVVAYGLILPQSILDTPRLGCLNVHASLLPRWRGAAPIQRAIESGDETTGITIMQMDAGLDTGKMLATSRCETATHTAASLHDELAKSGPPLLLEVLDDLENYLRNAQPQDDEKATYASKITKAEAEIDWEQDSLVIERRVRAFNSFPICYSQLGEQRIRIWSATQLDEDAGDTPPGTIMRADAEGIAVSCGQGQLLIKELQLPGGKALSAGQILNAQQQKFAPGERFSNVVMPS